MNRRKDNIRKGLADLKAEGRVYGWMTNAPGGVGQRWNVWGRGFDRTFSTAEVEAFLVGATTGV